MHDNIRASEVVKNSKSMVFLIPTVNRRNYGGASAREARQRSTMGKKNW